MIEIEKLGCGFVEMKLLHNAHILDNEGVEVFKFFVRRNEQGKIIKEFILLNNIFFKIFSRFDSSTTSMYLGIDADKNVLIVKLKDTNIEFKVFDCEGSAFSFAMENIA